MNVMKGILTDLTHNQIRNAIVAHIHKPLRKSRNSKRNDHLLQNGTKRSKIHFSFCDHAIDRMSCKDWQIQRTNDCHCSEYQR